MNTTIKPLQEFRYFRINVVTGDRALSVYYGRDEKVFHEKIVQWNAMLPNQWKYEIAYPDAIKAHNA